MFSPEATAVPSAALERLAQALSAALGPDAVHLSQPLAGYTSLRVGGKADLISLAQNARGLREAVTMAWDAGLPCRVLGSGANVLVGDAGFRGLVVINRARGVSFSDDAVQAESGAILASVARECVDRALAGLEWAAGIPGTVGGAIVGNAGAWGGDVASALRSASILEPDGTVSEWPVEKLQYGYRTSLLKQQPQGVRRAVVLGAEFGLRPGDRQALEARVAQIQTRRRESQPPGASCGSVFKNPAGDHAGRLIEVAGLKGHVCGGAQLSTVHANFVINLGGATAADVKSLIDLARQTVQSQAGVALELEVELVGDW